MPNLIGYSVDQASEQLGHFRGLKINELLVTSERAKGEVVSTSPQSGQPVYRGGRVVLRVSNGPPVFVDRAKAPGGTAETSNRLVWALFLFLQGVFVFLILQGLKFKRSNAP